MPHSATFFLTLFDDIIIAAQNKILKYLPWWTISASRFCSAGGGGGGGGGGRGKSAGGQNLLQHQEPLGEIN